MKMSDLKNKTEKELIEILNKSRVIIREERFKEKFGNKPNIIRNSKLDVSRILTELSNRRHAVDKK